MRDPPGPVFPEMSRFVDLTATSARQLAWGLYAAVMRCWTLHDARKSRVVWAANSGPPSDVSVSGMPYVENVSLSVLMRPSAPFLEMLTTGQLEYRSTSTRYATPPWWK